MDMNKEDEVALEESISDWKDKTKALNKSVYEYKKCEYIKCPLCTLGKNRNKSDVCKDCIIRKHTGLRNCNDTPYWPRNMTLGRIQREIEFLESLRPEKKVKEIIEIGDKVTLYDSSYLIRLNNGKIGSRYDKQLLNAFNNGKNDTHYIVLETGTRLPEGSDHKGEYGNDTIIYNPEDGSYIFTYHKFLKLVEPRHCSECGKAK